MGFLDFLGFQNPTQLDKRALALREALGANSYLMEYVIPGHPLPVRTEWVFTAAQTNATLIAAVTARRNHLTHLAVFLPLSATVSVPVRIGFATSTLAAEASGGVAGIVVNHELAPGGGIVLGDGGSPFAQSAINQALRITSGVPTGSKLIVIASYFETDLP